MTNQKNKLLDFSLLSVIFTLAWPTMLEQLMQTTVQYIDTAMVGALGTEATAAVGSTYTVNWLINSAFFALGIGFLAYISKAYGAKEYEKATKASAQAVFIVLLTSAVLTVVVLSLSKYVPVWMQVDKELQGVAARYFFILYIPLIPRACSMVFGTVLRAAGDTKTPMRVGLIVNAINIVLNFILIYPTRNFHGVTIYGAGLGTDGAAIGSAISFVVGGALITIALWRHPVLSPKGQSLKPDKSVLVPCLKVSIPNILQRVGTSMGFVVFASMINSLGQVATAAHTIANTVESAFYIPGHGMQTAAATLSGNTLGERDKEKMVSLSRMLIFSEVCMMIISGALLFVSAPAMVGLFSSNKVVIALGSTVLRMVAVSEPFYGVSVAIEGMMQGVGRTIRPFVYDTACMWLVRISGTWIMIHLLGGGLISAWACMITHNMILFVLYTTHYRSGKWHPLS